MAIKPWPLPIRLIHWSLVALLSTDLLLLEAGEWAHKYAGFSMAGLVCLRVGFLVFSRNPAYKLKLPSVAAIKRQISQRHWSHAHHSPLGALMIFSIWSSMLAAASSGYLQTTDAFWGEEWVELLHSLIVYSLFTLILLHIMAIVLLQTLVKLPLLQRMGRDKSTPN